MRTADAAPHPDGKGVDEPEQRSADADAAAGAGPRPVATSHRPWRTRYIVVGLVFAAVFGFLAVKGLAGSLNYFETVNQAVQQRATLGSQTFRMEGVVVPGTVHDTSGGVDFTVSSNGVSEAVVETGAPPQLFQPDVPVVVVGHFAGNVFASDQIIVDHGSQYVASHPGRVRGPGGKVCENGRCSSGKSR